MIILKNKKTINVIFLNNNFTSIENIEKFVLNVKLENLFIFIFL